MYNTPATLDDREGIATLEVFMLLVSQTRFPKHNRSAGYIRAISDSSRWKRSLNPSRQCLSMAASNYNNTTKPAHRLAGCAVLVPVHDEQGLGRLTHDYFTKISVREGRRSRHMPALTRYTYQAGTRYSDPRPKCTEQVRIRE